VEAVSGRDLLTAMRSMSTRRVQLVDPVSPDEAAAILLRHLRTAAAQRRGLPEGERAWDLDLDRVIHGYLLDYDRARSPNAGPGSKTLVKEIGTRAFYDVAWQLVARGILRPVGTGASNGRLGRSLNEDAFLLTAYGLEWVEAAPENVVLPTEFAHFGELLARYGDRFGGAYRLRSLEALRSYRAQCYLACCTMCGAAAEAILLTLAMARADDAALVRQEYLSARGREKVLNRLKAQQNGEITRTLDLFAELLKYWRDTASHGAETGISEAEAFTSLLLLLRLAQFAGDRWTELTTAPPPQAPAGSTGARDAR
jgi:hypothetical protein